MFKENTGMARHFKVMTGRGIQLANDLIVGDTVIGSNGKPVTITKVDMIDDPKIQRSVVRTQHHQFLNVGSNNKLPIIKAFNRKDQKIEPIVAQEIADMGVRDSSRHLRYQLANTPMINGFEKSKLTADPYLIGWLLDHIVLSNKASMLIIDTVDIDTLNQIADMLKATVEYAADDGQYMLRSTKQRRYLHLEDLAIITGWQSINTVGIPLKYIISNYQTRQQLMQGLFKDQQHLTVNVEKTKTTLTYFTYNKNLADDLKELLLNLGIGPEISPENRNGNLGYTIKLTYTNAVESLLGTLITDQYPAKAIDDINMVDSVRAFTGGIPLIRIEVDAPDHLFVGLSGGLMYDATV